MVQIYTYEQAVNSGEWGKQLNRASNLQEAWKKRVPRGSSLTILPRQFSEDIKQQFENLTQFLIEKENVSPENSEDLLSLEYQLKTPELLKAARNSGQNFQEALTILEKDIADFKKIKTHGGRMKLRVQGAWHENGDSDYHSDGGDLLLVRYSGPQTQEVNFKDVMAVKTSGDAQVNSNPRVLTPEYGDVVAHRENKRPWEWGSPAKSVHKKGAANGKPGIVLTLQ